MGKAQTSEVLSVSQALLALKSIVDGFTFRIIGEVSELHNKAGYKAVYFTIKDDKSALPCLIWKNIYSHQGVNLDLGAKVEVTGKFGVYAPTGDMKFYVSSLTLEGEGRLRQQVARLAEKLRREGLTDPARKRSCVPYPEKIGLITSPSGAVVHDVLRTLRLRYPYGKVFFAGVQVEGKTAHQQMIEALHVLAQAGAEVILLVRGGGSFESFMPFNEEDLARAIVACPVPVVTGLGHEHDNMIADLVADIRTTSPTAAASAISPSQDQLKDSFQVLLKRMTTNINNTFKRLDENLLSFAGRPCLKDPLMLFETDFQRLDMIQTRFERFSQSFAQEHRASLSQYQLRLEGALPHALTTNKAELASLKTRLISQIESVTGQAHLSLQSSRRAFLQVGKTLVIPYKNQAALAASRLEDLSPVKTLERGWSIARDSAGGLVSSTQHVNPQDKLTIQLKDGSIDCTVEAIHEMRNYD